jgi:polyphosphate kinase 2 (PPK2 family)
VCIDELKSIDQTALSHWGEYSSARDALLEQTHHS